MLKVDVVEQEIVSDLIMVIIDRLASDGMMP
jgi:hypothetical protein